jgi:hypothetical protein
MPLSVAVYRTNALALYGVLVLRDPACDAPDIDDGQARRAAATHMVAANPYQAFIHAAQTVVRVDVELRLHTTAPDSPPDGACEVSLVCPTGSLLVEQVSAGPAPLVRAGTPADPPVNEAALPAGPGVYRLRVHDHGRDATAHAVHATLTANQGAPVDRLAAALAPLHGREHYTVTAWYTGPLPAEPDDEDDLD